MKQQHVEKDVSIQVQIRRLIARMDNHKANREYEDEIVACLELMELFLSTEDYGKAIVFFLSFIMMMQGLCEFVSRISAEYSKNFQKRSTVSSNHF